MQTAYSLISKRRRSGFDALALTLSLVFFSYGCSSGPVLKVPTHEEQVQQDNAIGLELSRQFESKLKLKTDSEVQTYLQRVAQRLADATPDLKSAKMDVLLVNDKPGLWQNFGLPGYRIYLSSGLLRNLEFENEVAAVIAYELAHLLKRDALSNLKKSTGVDSVELSVPGSLLLHAGEDSKGVAFSGPKGIFQFKEDQILAADASAVSLLYRTGYDARGLVSVWEKYGAHADHSPYSHDLLSRLSEQARQTIDLYVPLRNPVVRSDAFHGIQERIRKL